MVITQQFLLMELRELVKLIRIFLYLNIIFLLKYNIKECLGQKKVQE